MNCSFIYGYLSIYVCLSECMAGLFGENCNGTCGNCSNGESCHHINGSCMHGCDPNYQGLFCTEGKSLYVKSGPWSMKPYYPRPCVTAGMTR